MKRYSSWVYAALLVPAIAAAQPKTADDWYKEGENQYNLGNFQGAVDAFKKGFEVEPNDSKKAAYLYNVAQSYRQAKDCSNAQFFYKRYLALKDADTKKPLAADKRAQIESLLKEVEDCAKQQEALRQKPPDQNLKPEGDEPEKGKGTGDKGTGDKGTGKVVGEAGGEGEGEGEGEEGGVTKTAPSTAPHLISLRAVGGAAILKTGNLDVPTQATFALLAGYPLAINDQLSLDLGAGFTFTPVPYDSMGTSKNAKLMAVMANVGATYAVTSKIGLRADAGVGVLFFGGISNSPFTDNQPTTGALSMFHLRVGVSAEYAITPNVLATLTPFTFSYSPAKTGLRSDISSITAIDLMLGVGYRM